jgi:hypothetical protein
MYVGRLLSDKKTIGTLEMMANVLEPLEAWHKMLMKSLQTPKGTLAACWTSPPVGRGFPR